MTVILALKGERKSHRNQKTKIIQLIIMIKKAYNKHVGEQPTANISDGSQMVTSPGSKALALVDNNSLSCGGGWRQFVGPRCILGKVRHSLGVWIMRFSQPDGDRWVLNIFWKYLVGA